MAIWKRLTRQQGVAELEFVLILAAIVGPWFVAAVVTILWWPR